LLKSFTASYATSDKQQSVQLFIGVAFSKQHLLEKITESQKKGASLFLLKS